MSRSCRYASLQCRNGLFGNFRFAKTRSAWSFGRPPAGDNALLDIVTLLKQRCKPASTASLLQTHGSASSAVVGDACGKLTWTSARPVNPADALRRTPSRRHGVPVQCAGSTHRLDSRSFARFDPVAPRRQRVREQQQSNSNPPTPKACIHEPIGPSAPGRAPQEAPRTQGPVQPDLGRS